MTEMHASLTTKIDRAFFALCIALFIWTVAERITAASPRAGDTDSVFIAAALVLMSGVDLMKERLARRAVMAATAGIVGFVIFSQFSR